MVRDAKISKGNKRLILTTGFIMMIVSITYLLSIYVGGIFRDFCEVAIPWVLMGIGVACSTAYLSQKE